MLLTVSLLLMLPPLCLLCSKRLERLLPPFIFSVTLICYVFAMFRGLAYLQWLALPVCIALWSFAVAAVVREGAARLHAFAARFFTPALLCLIALGVFFTYAADVHIVKATDDIHYWGLEPLSLFVNNGLVDATHHLAPRFMAYTPGMQLLQWLALNTIGEWSEQALYATLFLTYAILLMPLTERITWKRCYLIPLYPAAVVVIPALHNNDAFAMLRVDTLMGLCTGYALVQVIRLCFAEKRSPFTVVCLTLSLCFLTLLKQVGIAWILLPLTLILVLRPWKRKLLTARQFIEIALLPLVVFASWKVFCLCNGLNGTNASSTLANLTAFVQGRLPLSEEFAQLPQNIWTELIGTNSAASSSLPILLWTAIYAIVPLFAFLLRQIDGKQAIRLSCWVVAGFALYLVSYSVALPTVFNGESITNLVALVLTRYACPFYLGLLYTCAYLAAETVGSRKNPAWGRVGVCCAALLLSVFCVDWSTQAHNLNPFATRPEQPESLYVYTEENTWVEQLDEPEHAIVLLASESYPYEFTRIQYVLAPVKLVYNFSDPLSLTELEALLQAQQVTHIMLKDELNPVYNALYEAFGEEPCTETLYSVEWVDGKPVIDYY